MTTIRDIARHAHVSITTASYVLNNTGKISEATRQRVLQAANELNYHPNAHARHLRNVRTRNIGVFISRFGGAFYEDILEGIHSIILNTDYELLVCPESRSPRRMLLHRQTDGAIVFDSKVSNDSLLNLASQRFPIVVLDRPLHADFLLPILLDNDKGAREVFQHFYNQGLRRMLYMAGSPDSFDNSERASTFLREAEQHGIQVKVAQGYFTEASGYEAARTALANPPLPEAVFCANDQMAIGFLQAMQEHGLRAPEDIAIVGFDNIPLSSYINPSLSTVGASRFDWGASATRQLLDFLETGEKFQPYRIPTHFIARQSSQKKQTNPALP